VKTVAVFHGERVAAYRYEADPGGDPGKAPVITVYPNGGRTGDYISVIWNLSVTEARKLLDELSVAVASVSGEGERS
jgi:hypothetical protein